MSYMETKIVRNVRDEPDASSTEQRSNHDDSVRTNVRMWTNMIRIISSSVYSMLDGKFVSRMDARYGMKL